MDGRRAVLFKKFKVTRYSYEKLSFCKSCGKYTVLAENEYECCNKMKLIHIDRHFHITLRRRFQIDILVLFILFFSGIIFARNLHEIYIMAASGLALIFLYLFLYKAYKKSGGTMLMLEFFKRHYNSIFKGLKMDADAAGEKMESGDFKGAYEDFREIGVLLRNDPIKLSKLLCLDKFILRKDESLELETLIPTVYNPLFVDYINDIAKLSPALVGRKVIDYVIAWEDVIAEEQVGTEVLGRVAEAAIRTRNNVVLYKSFISRYLNLMKKDRLARLYALLKEGNIEGLDGLYKEVAHIIYEKYRDDPQFKGILA
ncbi:hypothetical protein OXPF_27570 [Oxobacter pfennigii]|uniref:Uncharacterized protein n=1 Tax=Oxobacter pfennigii TaxID=36849 RepID=A0A0P8Y955_9CLOT|nr:hypothetical protein [Oxobacter pfennigii]KPU43316.1 hypothetical protein OXPF_27570 [Oxobacter pfennigii]